MTLYIVVFQTASHTTHTGPFEDKQDAECYWQRSGGSIFRLQEPLGIGPISLKKLNSNVFKTRTKRGKSGRFESAK